MKLKDILKEENWKADKNIITLDGEKVGDYSFDRDADGFFIDDISGKGQKGFDTKGEMIDYIKKNKSAYLKARKAYASRGYMREGKLNEASEIQLTDLQPTQQKQIKAFEQLLGGKHIVIFDGIHGFVVNIKVSGVYGNYRFEADDLKKLLTLKIRWIEADGDYISIAF